MIRPSLSAIVATVFLSYIGHSVWSIYHLYNPPACPPSQECLYPAWDHNTKHQMMVCGSRKSSIHSSSDLHILWKSHAFDISETQQIEMEVDVPRSTVRNGSYFLHLFVNPNPGVMTLGELLVNPGTSYGGSSLTKLHIPIATPFNLMGQQKPQVKVSIDSTRVVSHWKSKLSIYGMSQALPLHRKAVPWEISPLLKLNGKREYLPIVYASDLGYRISDLSMMNGSSMSLSLTYVPVSVGRLRLLVTVEQAMKTMHKLGFSEKDTDEVKSIFFDTNIYLLLVTCMVSALHLLFDLLSFKNDIGFWRSRKDMVGVSQRSLRWRCFSQLVISLYLLDEHSSLLVLGPSFLAALIEIWKLTKASKLEIRFQGIKPTFKFGESSDEEQKTRGFDMEGMGYLSYVLYPLVLGGALYSLVYSPHRSWYSWCIQSLANGVYAFGFLFMLPQLFINYRLKSVAHLPWRAFMYKAFNTFIDDLFAFVISMPTAHRVACFRDDFVFLVYLYQRWLYPVDKERVNEFGQSYKAKDQ